MTPLYVIAAAPPQRIRKLTPGKLVALPGARERKTIEHMTTVELGSIIDDLAPPAHPQVPIAEVLERVRSRIAALRTSADAMIERADEIDDGAAQQIRTELSELVSKIEAALPA